MGRRIGAWLVAAVVTAALVVGGVVVAGGRDREPAVLPPLDLNGTQTAAAAAAAATEPARMPTRAARPFDTGDAPLLRPAVTYRLRGTLPDLPDRARAWKLGRDADSGRMAALVAALGLRGQAKQDQAGWTVRDGTGTLRVNRLAGLPWSFGNVVARACVGGPWSPAGDRGIQCLTKDPATAGDPKAGAAPGGAVAGTTGSGAGSPASPGTARPVVPERISRSLPRPADLPSRETAERIARELAAKAGLGLDGATVRVADVYAARVVTIAPAVGGLPTHGVAWTVSVGPKGRVQYASGWLATPQPADTYPLMSEAEALKRLRERSAFRPPIVRPDVAARVREVPCPPVTRLPCTGKPAPKRTVTITGVRLGLQLTPGVARGSSPAEVAYLLPAYLFDLEGGWTDVQAVVAVQDRYLTRPGP